MYCKYLHTSSLWLTTLEQLTFVTDGMARQSVLSVLQNTDCVQYHVLTYKTMLLGVTDTCLMASFPIWTLMKFMIGWQWHQLDQM